MPDDELFKLAPAKGLTGEPGSASPSHVEGPKRSQALVENFAGQWLRSARCKMSARTPPIFTNFDDALRTAMTQERSLFFNAIIQEDRSVLDFSTAISPLSTSAWPGTTALTVSKATISARNLYAGPTIVVACFGRPVF